ncbi:hypothetical protein [Novosphingobium sp.]|uniref:hypothetical protein n=1 Tax=Novosphingobium sp. TaxID=1874826 RepID=UPI003BA841E7
MPRALSANRYDAQGAITERQMVEALRSLDRQLHEAAQPLDPRQARIRAIDGERLLIESIGAQPFTVNGRSATSSELDVATGAELGFGGHRITLAREAESGLPLDRAASRARPQSDRPRPSRPSPAHRGRSACLCAALVERARASRTD